tara:strand:- start:209 stop:466 length:258 start_codon:yes stop_codon:yes gene_type:complete
MEIAANLLRLSNEWIVAQVDEVEGELIPGDPDCILRQPFMVDYDGNLTKWPHNSDDREVIVRSSDITTIVSPSKDLLANYIKSLE